MNEVQTVYLRQNRESGSWLYTLSYVLLLSFLLGAERGAELRTRERVLYGKFEARYKPAQGEGLVSSFFVYNDDTP